MSSTIIYHAVGMTLPPDLTGLDEDIFLIAAQMGDSNCYEISRTGGNGRRSRSWSALHWGTADHIIEDAIRTGGGFEGGMIHLDHYRGYTSPEQYIRRCRRLLAEARDRRGPSIQFKNGYVFVGPTSEHRVLGQPGPWMKSRSSGRMPACGRCCRVHWSRGLAPSTCSESPGRNCADRRHRQEAPA
jgi:hypothetical protein